MSERNVSDEMEMELRGAGNNIRVGASLAASASRRTLEDIRRARKSKTIKKAAEKISKALMSNEKARGFLVIASMVLVVLLLVLYALPSSAYSSLQFIFGYTEEDFERIKYRHPVYEEGAFEAADIQFHNGLTALKFIASTGLWDLRNIDLNSLPGDLDDSQREALQEVIENSRYGVTAVEEEASMKDTVRLYTEVAAEKLNERMSQIFRDIRSVTREDNEELEELLERRFNVWLSEKRAAGDETEYTFDGKYRVAVSRTPVTVKNGAELLALYCAQKNNSALTISAGEYYRWLGCFFDTPEREDALPQTYFDLLGVFHIRESKEWFGGCLPQYLEEQRHYEMMTYGEVVTDFSPYEVAAVDIAVVIEAPDIMTLTPSISPTGEVSFLIPIKIKMRDSFQISQVLGLTGGRTE